MGRCHGAEYVGAGCPDWQSVGYGLIELKQLPRHIYDNSIAMHQLNNSLSALTVHSTSISPPSGPMSVLAGTDP